MALSYLPEFVTVAGIGLLAAMAPGPDFFIVSRNALRYGRKTGIATALGIAIGIFIHIGYSLIGIGLVIANSIVAFNVIRLLGAAYLIYLGLSAILSKRKKIKITETQAAHPISSKKAFSIGFLTNILNPKAALFFVGLFSQVIDPNTPSLVQFLMGSQIAVIALVWF